MTTAEAMQTAAGWSILARIAASAAMTMALGLAITFVGDEILSDEKVLTAGIITIVVSLLTLFGCAFVWVWSH